MNKNVIFYFSGTGNCLEAAKDIAKALADCQVISMSSKAKYIISDNCERIGFIYPTYFLGIPLKVRDFISKLVLPSNKNVYYFAVTTCGSLAGNALPQLKELLEEKNINLQYGAKHIMFSNYVVMYNMKAEVEKITKASSEKLRPIIEDIRNKHCSTIKKSNTLVNLYYKRKEKQIPTMDKDYAVSQLCNSCGMCSEVCPVGNITMVSGKPNFQHHCEQCVACIQFCPKRAINYKDKTQKRRRYTNPNISFKELAQNNRA